MGLGKRITVMQLSKIKSPLDRDEDKRRIVEHHLTFNDYLRYHIGDGMQITPDNLGNFIEKVEKLLVEESGIGKLTGFHAGKS